MISLVISSCRSWRERPTSSSSILATLLLAAVIARMRASFSAASDSVSASQSSANTYSWASSASRTCGGSETIGGDGVQGAREAGEIERRERPVDDLDLAQRRRRMDDVDPRRPPRAEARVELLGHPVGERADLVDMGDHRGAPADGEPALLGRHEPASAEQHELRCVRPSAFDEALGDIEHAPVEHAGETLLGAERNDEMAAAARRAEPTARSRRRRARAPARSPRRRSLRRRARLRHARAPRARAPRRCRASRRSPTTVAAPS